MHGYDTLAGAWDELTRDWSAIPWQSVQRDEVKGSLRCILNTERVQFTRAVKVDPHTGEVRQMGTAFQASLPKLLYGKNSRTLPVDDHPDALAKLDQVIQQWFPGAPPVSEMTPRRIDATDDRDLGGELAVSAALTRLQAVELRGKRPWVGQVGTISWPGKRGSHTSKAYSKYVESGDPESIGTLRVERGAVGLRCIRSDYTKAAEGALGNIAKSNSAPDGITDLAIAKALAAASQGGDLSIGQALACAGLPAAILGPFSGIVDAVVKEVEQVTVGELFSRALAAGMTPARAASLIGYANVIQHFGAYHNTMLTRQGQYKLRKDFERIGCDPKAVEFGPLYMSFIGPPRTMTPEEISAAKLRQVEEDEREARAGQAEAKRRISRRAKEAPPAVVQVVREA